MAHRHGSRPGGRFGRRRHADRLLRALCDESRQARRVPGHLHRGLERRAQPGEPRARDPLRRVRAAGCGPPASSPEMSAQLRFAEQGIAPGDFERAVRQAAQGLEELGVGAGDVVCIMLHNQPAFLEAMFAARLLGAYYCPINWHYKAEEAGWILSDSGAKVLVTDPEVCSQIRAGLPDEVYLIDDWTGWRNGFGQWAGEARPP